MLNIQMTVYPDPFLYSNSWNSYSFVYLQPDVDPTFLTDAKIKHHVSLLQQKYILYWQLTMRNKNEYTSSRYLPLTKKLNNRKELVKFRINNHKLMIETGRYDQIPRFNRPCPTCGSDQMENEMH